MTEPTAPEKKSSDPLPPASPEENRRFWNRGFWLVVGIVGLNLWFWATMEIVTYLNGQVFPELFPTGLLKPQPAPYALLLEGTILMLIGVGIAMLFTPYRRLIALRTLPSMMGIFLITFWLGGGEIAQIDEQGFWRTQALGVADEYYPWPTIHRIKLLPYVWHQRTREGLRAELRMRMLVVPSDSEASVVELGPRPDWQRLDKLLEAHRPIVTADEPEGIIASVYRFQPEAPEADLLRRFAVPAPPLEPVKPIKANDPIDYWWYQRVRGRR